MTMKRRIIFGLSALAAMFYACAAVAADAHDHAAEEHDHAAEVANDAASHPHPEAEADTDAHDHEGEAGAAAAAEEEAPLTLTAAQRNAFLLRTDRARAGQLTRTVRLHGEFSSDPDRIAKLMPRLAGFVKAVYKSEGDTVKAGDVLAEIGSLALGELYSDYHSALALEELTRLDHERNAKLFETQAIAERDYQRTRREYADAVIRRQRAEELLLALGFDPADADHDYHGDVKVCTSYLVRAPFDGMILTRDLSLGENFPEDNAQVLFTVANFDRVFLDLNARQEELPQLAVGQEVKIEVGPGYPAATGTLTAIAPVADPLTRLVRVRVAVANPTGQLRPGLFATGSVTTAAADHTVLLERDAVVLLGTENVVFVPQGDGFAARPVTTGGADRNHIEVLAGLTPGEEYVSAGAFELKSVLLTSGMDSHAGHGH